MDFDSMEFKSYIVPKKDKLSTYKRKPKAKYKKSLIKFSRQTRSFYKSEGIFKQWLKENIQRFNTKPIAKTGGAYYFEDVIKNVQLRINFGLPESMIAFDSYITVDEYYDQHSIDYIGYEKYHPQKGFYDGDNEVYDYFPTQKELYINNTFEPIIEYCNEYITPKHSLYFLNSFGWSIAFIEVTDENNEIVKKRVIGDGFIEDLSDQECEKLFVERKAYKTIKYDLFDIDKAPLIRYKRMDS
jgi:hypothetical protein